VFGQVYKLTIEHSTTSGTGAFNVTETLTESWVISDLRCTWAITADLERKPNAATIEIYNLSPNTLQKLAQLGRVTLEAGYEDESTAVIFKGNVLEVITKQKGGDSVTELRCSDGGLATQLGFISVSYQKNTPWLTVANDVLTAVVDNTGLGADGSRDTLARISASPYTRGFSASGSALSVLDTVLAKAGHQMSIQNGDIQIVAIGRGITSDIIELSPTSGLIGSPDFAGALALGAKRAQSTEKSKVGWLKVEALCQYRIRPGQTIFLTSNGHSGNFICKTIAHKGDSHGSAPWMSTLELEKV